jgi:hypothetical protein
MVHKCMKKGCAATATHRVRGEMLRFRCAEHALPLSSVRLADSGLTKYFLEAVFDHGPSLAVVCTMPGSDEAGSWGIGQCSFVSKDGRTLTCPNCWEELGELSDENVEHQSEYHSCAV